MNIEVEVIDQQQDLLVHKVAVSSLVREVLAHQQCVTNGLAVYLVSQEEIADLHLRFFNDPTPTDTISFPIDPPLACVPHQKDHFLGEVFVCPKVAIEYVSLQRTEPRTRAIYEELTLYLVHGLLHLLGHNDLEEEEKFLMEATQQHLLNILIDKKLTLYPQE